MKENTNYVFKSQRLAQAKKKADSSKEKQLEKRTQRRRIRRKTDSRKINQGYLLKAVRDPSHQSLMRIQLIEKHESSSRTRSIKTEEDTQKMNAHKKGFVSHMNTLNVKSPAKDDKEKPDHIEIIEDGNSFTEKEVQFFEQKYEDVLFDNTITVSQNHQVQFEKLSQRKFRSYRTGDKAVELNKNSFEFKQKLSCVNYAFGYNNKINFTDSQIHALSHLCGSMKCLKLILNSNRKLVQSFFESLQGIK